MSQIESYMNDTKASIDGLQSQITELQSNFKDLGKTFAGLTMGHVGHGPQAPRLEGPRAEHGMSH